MDHVMDFDLSFLGEEARTPTPVKRESPRKGTDETRIASIETSIGHLKRDLTQLKGEVVEFKGTINALTDTVNKMAMFLRQSSSKSENAEDKGKNRPITQANKPTSQLNITTAFRKDEYAVENDTARDIPYAFPLIAKAFMWYLKWDKGRTLIQQSLEVRAKYVEYLKSCASVADFKQKTQTQAMALKKLKRYGRYVNLVLPLNLRRPA